MKKDSGVRKNFLKIKKAKVELGFQPQIYLEKGLKETLKYYEKI